MIIEIIICLALGYIFGCFQSGYFYGKIFHSGMDVRDYGSGNAGSTNVVRTIGKRAGYIVFLCDALKACFAVWLVRYVLFAGVENELILELFAGFGTMLGHDYPFFLHFKGGKGIAVTGGFMFAVDWRMALIAIIVFAIIFYSTRYVSIGSLVITLLFPVMMWVRYPGQWAVLGISILFTALAWWRHRDNIKRLLNGTENRFERKKKE